MISIAAIVFIVIFVILLIIATFIYSGLLLILAFIFLIIAIILIVFSFFFINTGNTGTTGFTGPTEINLRIGDTVWIQNVANGLFADPCGSSMCNSSGTALMVTTRTNDSYNQNGGASNKLKTIDYNIYYKTTRINS